MIITVLYYLCWWWLVDYYYIIGYKKKYHFDYDRSNETSKCSVKFDEILHISMRRAPSDRSIITELRGGS